jgi:predicted nucleic-acid-binding protein
MRAIDTNILVRLLTKDEPKQYALVLALLAEHTVFVSKTVLLELEWVLRYSYGFERANIASALALLLDMKDTVFEDVQAIREAVRLYFEGNDFGDALHLASSFACDDLVTFDKAFAKRLATSSPNRVSLL